MMKQVLKTALFTTLALCLLQSKLHAQDSDSVDPNSLPLPEQPASELETNDETISPTNTQQDDPTKKEKSIEEIGSDSWETYSGSSSTMAKDITGGLRVEDVIEPLTDYAYAAFGKPDPFIAPYYKQKNTNYSLEVPIVSVLQTYEVKELKIAGIWQSLGGERKALIMSHDNKVGVEVMKGDPIGKKAGKVLEVRPESVLIREYYLTRDGTREFEDVELLLPNDFSNKTGGTIVLTPESPDEIKKQPAATAPTTVQTIKGTEIQTTVKAPAGNTAKATEAFLPGTMNQEGTKRAAPEVVDIDKIKVKDEINAPATKIDQLNSP